MKATDQKIYLASKSPRRRELLRQIGIEFELLLLREQMPRGADVTELSHPGEVAAHYVARVTREKVEQANQVMLWRRLPIRPILAADTTVVIDEQILGKPADMAEAVEMIQVLSGRTHQVITSIALHHDGNVWDTTQRSDVVFTPLSNKMIQAYCATPEPYDKAGGYGIQGLASIFIQDIAGSYSGIMGLPLFETAQLLQKAGLTIL